LGFSGKNRFKVWAGTIFPLISGKTSPKTPLRVVGDEISQMVVEKNLVPKCLKGGGSPTPIKSLVDPKIFF